MPAFIKSRWKGIFAEILLSPGNPFYCSLDLFCLVKSRFEAFFRFSLFMQNGKQMKETFQVSFIPCYFVWEGTFACFCHVWLLSSKRRHEVCAEPWPHQKRIHRYFWILFGSSTRKSWHTDNFAQIESLLSTNRILHRLNITSPWCTFAFTIIEALVREHLCSSQYHQLTGIIYVTDIVFHHS